LAVEQQRQLLQSRCFGLNVGIVAGISAKVAFLCNNPDMFVKAEGRIMLMI
jgi:hypothetical protein